MQKKQWFIADTHFGDERILRYENRPFPSVSEMDEILIQHWNQVVAETDEVFLIGDVGQEAIIEKLCGQKYLIKGNHDEKSNREYRDCGFLEVYDHPIILEGFWILSHEPLYVNESMPYANIFGHVHNSPIYKDYSSQHYCVSVERIHYTPISFQEIKRQIQQGKGG